MPEAPSDAFVEALLRGEHDARSSSVAVEEEARLHKRALDGAGVAPLTVSSEVAAYLAMRRAVTSLDHALLESLGHVVWPRVATHARAWASFASAGARIDLPRTQGTDALSIALAVDALVLDATRPVEGLASGAARALGLAREAAALAGGADQPHAQYQAYLALARARRHTGRVPMATRLVASLLRSAPSTYRAELAWEAFLVGLRDRVEGDALALSHAIAAATAGDRALFDAASLSLLARTSSARVRHAEARALLTAIDPFVPFANLDRRTFDFVSCLRADLEGLEGAVIDASDPDAPIAIAIVSPTGVRRFLAPGRGLLGRIPQVSASEHGGRTETAILTLAAAPTGLDEESFFRAVYGFAFKKALHDGVLRVLLTRVRQAIEPHARLVREGDRLRLVVEAPFTLVDPRVATRADNAVLRAIASDRALSAKEIAERTGLPLRTVQAELGRLVDEGVCRREKDGRNTEYLVEDTVVREPSRVLSAADLAR
ncbi:MAG: winged helix-turn-helix domain-containing protein [Deltaproteobacteria bacterium]|nr:winged helix-turn-helix domain-containing protein [Deltaproteobacteria bacterium]